MSVSNMSKNCSIGRLRVQTGVDERHLLEDKCERIKRWGQRALLRVEVMRISKRERQRVGGTNCLVSWRHAKEKTER
jgi:hypothetical protein